jgi:hypothetical protein
MKLLNVDLFLNWAWSQTIGLYNVYQLCDPQQGFKGAQA